MIKFDRELEKIKMNKFHILAIVLFGFLLISISIFVCENNSAQHSSQKVISSKTCNSDCCKKDGHSKDKNHHACNGKCGHSNCVTSSTHFSVLPSETRFQINNFSFSEKNQNYFNSETNLSSGFSSIWLIPKIG